MKECLQNFFNSSTLSSQDIVIFGIGMSYCRSYPLEEVNTTSWLVETSQMFMQDLYNVFPGLIIRMSLSPTRYRLKGMMPCLTNMNEVLWNTISPIRPLTQLNQLYPRLFTIDQWIINEGRMDLYDDYAHFPGLLTQASLHQILHLTCPRNMSEIIDTDVPVEIRNQRFILQSHEINEFNSLSSLSLPIIDTKGLTNDRYFFINSELQVLEFSGNHSCFSHFTIKKASLFSSDSLKDNLITFQELKPLLRNFSPKLTLATVLEDVCYEGNLLRGKRHVEVYQYHNQHKVLIPSRKAFLDLGFNFDNVKEISPILIHFIPLGK